MAVAAAAISTELAILKEQQLLTVADVGPMLAWVRCSVPRASPRQPALAIPCEPLAVQLGRPLHYHRPETGLSRTRKM